MGEEEIKISKDQLKNFYEKQKLSIRKLAKTYACDVTTIQRKLHKYNILVRPSMSIRLHIPNLRHPRMKSGLLKVRENIYWRNQKFGNLRMG